MSQFTGPGDVFLADCPARLAVEIIADKWAVVVLYGLSRGRGVTVNSWTSSAGSRRRS